MADHGEIGDSMTFEEIAWEFVEVFDELDISEINEMLVNRINPPVSRMVAELVRSIRRDLLKKQPSARVGPRPRSTRTFVSARTWPKT